MALKSSGTKIIMDEGDYGLALPFKIIGDGLLSTDTIKIIIKYKNKEYITKEFTDFSKVDGKFTFELEFSEEESKKLIPGCYIYVIKQYRENTLLNTIQSSILEVRKV